jgi:hypothetical protein
VQCLQGFVDMLANGDGFAQKCDAISVCTTPGTTRLPENELRNESIRSLCSFSVMTRVSFLALGLGLAFGLALASRTGLTPNIAGVCLWRTWRKKGRDPVQNDDGGDAFF